ncbi:uncharacterized protein LAESUDRAFT_765541 [Laetiporus sulphureus 93-53]|uniref:Uncharacterized protein n=1 Tax=Laetiporus sulphureus 93-53 TaxID=1314785 RepID=A0A165APY6_9APHY|nr:uncharacterized protein LAESUDRAFT_765541 [Laetiporus sulphureus 93-53]KZS99427.1 hypothetical protein LAESUDRAFT_765541 [Laetiporus sulphureus 93-53]
MFPEGTTRSEPADPWRSQATSQSSEPEAAAPGPEQPTSSTSKASGVVRNPSPSVLPEYATPSTWEWDGIPYATIEEAANVAAPATVPTDVKDWVMNVVCSIEDEILAHIHIEIMAVEIRDQLKIAKAQIGTLSADVERLAKSNTTLTAEAQAIHKDFEDYKNEVKGQTDALYASMVALKEAQEKTTTYIVGLESRLNNAIINAPPQGIQPLAGQFTQSPCRIKLPDPPKYSGRKSSENFETWFMNLQI